jgi:hypothetical protein
MTAEESWRRLVEPGGWMGARGLTNLEPGARYAATTAGGDAISGCVLLWQPPQQLAATVERFNNAYLRIDSRCIGENGTPWIWLSVYGLPDERVRRIEREWQTSLDAALA